MNDLNKEAQFKSLIRNQKCPFRTKRVKDIEGNELEELMPCDFNCNALIHQPNYSDWGCLRLVKVNIGRNEKIEIFSGIEE